MRRSPKRYDCEAEIVRQGMGTRSVPEAEPPSMPVRDHSDGTDNEVCGC